MILYALYRVILTDLSLICSRTLFALVVMSSSCCSMSVTSNFFGFIVKAVVMPTIPVPLPTKYERITKLRNGIFG